MKKTFDLEIYAQVWEDDGEFVYNVFVGPRDEETIVAYGSADDPETAMSEVATAISEYLGDKK